MTDQESGEPRRWRMRRRGLVLGLPTLAAGASIQSASANERAAITRAAEPADVTPVEFGADPRGIDDSIDAIEAARDAALASGRTLVFTTGMYRISRPLALGFPRLHVRGEGRAVIQAGFSGREIVSIDGGGTAFVYQGSLRNLVLRGDGSADQTGLYVRGVVHRHCADIRVRNVGGTAFLIESDVLSVYERLVSDLQHDGRAGEVQPQFDCVVAGTRELGATTACTFRDCIFEEARQVGLVLKGADCCLIEGGAAEGLPGWGVRVDAASRRNAFSNFYCEANDKGDFDVRGANNHFFNCEAGDPGRERVSFHLRPSAHGNVLERVGAFRGAEPLTIVVIDAGARDNTLRDVDVHRLDDLGSGTVLDNSGPSSTAKQRGRAATTFTPKLAGARTTGQLAYSAARGELRRNGNSVDFAVEIGIAAVQSPADGELFVAGLPEPATGDAIAAAVTIGPCDRVTLPAGATQFVASVAGDRIRLFGIASGSACVPLDAAQISPGTRLVLSGTYRVA